MKRTLCFCLWGGLLALTCGSSARSGCPPVHILGGEAENDWFGYSVSMAGDVDNDGFDDLIVGAPYNDSGGSIAGRAYVYSGQSGALLYIFTGEAEGDHFGYSVSSAGDVNSDGFDDLLIGAFRSDSGGFDAGRAYVYSGQSGSVLYTLTGEAEQDQFGSSVSDAGDVNDDGFDDFIIGAYYNDAGGVDAGRAYVYSGQDGTPLYTFDGYTEGGIFGVSVSGTGDVNNDGYDDVIVGARDDAGGSNIGSAYVFSGQDGTLLHHFTGEQESDGFGRPVSGAGDVNGDGFDDLIVGAIWSDAGAENVGQAYVYSGQDGALLYTFTGEGEGDKFGWSVSTAGNFDGDAYDDIIVGVWSGAVKKAYVYSGQNGALIDIFTSDDAIVSYIGYSWSVSGGGDINNDGFDDLLVGSPGAHHYENKNAGRAYAYYGGPCGGIINVPADQPTIQAGIDAADPGDTILVADGTYTGNGNRDIDFGDKNVVVKSANGPEFTIIDCEGSAGDPHRAFHIHGGQTSASVVDGFTIINGYGPFDGHNHLGGSGYSVGGAISCDYFADPIITNNIIENCYSEFAGGGIYIEDQSYPLIEGNTFSGNSADSWGGGIYLRSGYSIVSDNNFMGNSSYSGGGVCIRSGYSTIKRNDIRENTAHEGGGLWISGDRNSIADNIIIGNLASDEGGGIYLYTGSQDTISGNTIYGNSAYLGSAFYSRNHRWAVISNTLVAFNSSSSDSGAVDYYRSNEPTLICSNIYGNAGGDWVGGITSQLGKDGNFSRDPFFCDAASDDFHLFNISPCAPANNNCGVLIGALDIGCEALPINVDIKPGSCPNPLNLNGNNNHGKAMVPVAILGTDGFDVHDIDPMAVALEGIPAVRWSYEDVGSPYTDIDEDCTCASLGPDGIEDLTLKFNREDLVAMLDGAGNGDMMRLILTGRLSDSSIIGGSDCVWIRTGSKPENASAISLSDGVILHPNSPNPFNPVTRIAFDLPEATHVKLDIFNVLGQRVATLVDQPLEAGTHNYLWNASNAASGLYFYRLTAGKQTKIKKMLLLK